MDISVIVPTHNRKDKLMQCLGSLFKQSYPQDNFEVIVIDDGSIDGTDDLLQEIAREHPNFRYFRQPRKGPAAARNFGMAEARSEFVAFTDNDCIAGAGWLENMVHAHKSECAALAIGGLTRVNTHNTGALVSQFLSDGAIRVSSCDQTDVIFFPTCNVSVKKSLLGKEGFNELFPLPAGEDAEFFWRLFKQGNRFSYRQEIEIFHNCYSTFRSFLRQAYMYGRGNYLVQYIHGDHPLFAEIKTRNNPAFIAGTVINIVKIPRFSYILGKRLIKKYGIINPYQKIKIYLYFLLHKAMYIFGNAAEHLRVINMKGNALNEAGGDREQAKPEFIILDVTHRCNLRCNICEIRKDGPIQEFSNGEIKGLISQAIEWGVKEFVLSGGEAFIREDIFELLDFVRENKYRVGILTNGILLNETFINKLLPYLASGSLSLSVSLDALTPQIHDGIRGVPGCFEATFKGLKLLAEYKRQHPNINFNVISIVLNDNLEELLGLASMLSSLNVNSIQFQPLLANNLIMQDRKEGVRYWVPEERLDILDKVIDTLSEFKRKNPTLILNSEENLQLIKKYFRGSLIHKDVECNYAMKTMLIANNGHATTCFDSYGDTRNMSLREIFLSSAAEKARQRVKGCLRPCLLPCFTDK